MSTTIQPTIARHFHIINWSAVFAGVIFALASAWIMYLLGGALGLAIIDPNDQNIATGLGVGSAIWILLTWLVTLFVGGLIAGRLSGKTDPATGFFHGMTVWSICIVLTILTGAIGVNKMMETSAQLLSNSNATGVLLSASKSTDKSTDISSNATGTLALEANLKKQIVQLLSDNNANISQSDAQKILSQLSDTQLAKIATYLLQDKPEAAKNIMVVNSDLSDQQINQIINNLDTSIQNSKQVIKDYTQTVTNYTAAVLWIVLVSQLLSLITAIVGGWLGTNVINQKYPSEFRAFQGDMT